MIFSIKYRKSLFGNEKRQKLKYSALCNVYEMGSIRNVDLRNKITSMQCSRVKRLLEDDLHDRKVTPLFLIGKNLSKTFKFHHNIDINI